MTDTDGLRQRMAYALRDRLLTPTAGPTQWGFHLADAVLPIVTAWAEQQWLRIREAHDWQCDCDPDDPCRIRIALTEVRADALTAKDPA